MVSGVTVPVEPTANRRKRFMYSTMNVWSIAASVAPPLPDSHRRRGVRLYVPYVE
jgi:hypothetical protein